MKYKKGVYRISIKAADSNIDVIVFDGKKWWLPSWEIGLDLDDHNSSFTIDKDCIKELLWEWTDVETMTAKELLSDENIKKMASEYTGGQEDYQAFILACNVISEKMKSLKLYYWQKRDYHEGASFALAESVEEAKSLIVEKFKSNWLEDNKNEYWVQDFISNGRTNEEEFFTEETSGAYTILKEELEKEPQIFDATNKQGFHIWASL